MSVNVVPPPNSETILNTFLAFIIHKKTKMARITEHVGTKQYCKSHCLFFRFIDKMYLTIHFFLYVIFIFFTSTQFLYRYSQVLQFLVSFHCVAASCFHILIAAEPILFCY